MKEMDYQDVLSQQAIFGEELFLFSNKDMQKEVNFYQFCTNVFTSCVAQFDYFYPIGGSPYIVTI